MLTWDTQYVQCKQYSSQVVLQCACIQDAALRNLDSVQVTQLPLGVIHIYFMCLSWVWNVWEILGM